jgi:hypothetical protein
MLSHATEKKNVVALAQSLGYKPKVVTPAVTTLTVYQLVLAKNDATFSPDENYYLKVKAGLEVQSSSDPDITFITTDSLDFANPTDRETDVYERDQTGTPTFYLITKKVKAISATEISTTISFNTNDINYPTATINNENIIEITSVVDDDLSKWYEVPYLAQESIFFEQANMNNELQQYSNTIPYILEVQKVPKRFSVKVNSDNTMDLQFGSGDVTKPDEQILPNTKNKFHASFFHSYLKNGIPAGIQLAHICRSELDIPKDLFPIIKRVGTVSPIKGPAIYHGQGFVINSIFYFNNFLSSNSFNSLLKVLVFCPFLYTIIKQKRG